MGKCYLVLYAYYETDNSIKNLKFFLKNGVTDNKDVTFLFIINNNKLSVDMPNYKNVHVLKRNNYGYDFGAYSMALDKINIDNYKYFIFLNDTVKGPFIPRYLPKKYWYKLFTNMLSENTKLCGSTKNYDPNGTHIQSSSFCTDDVGVKLLIDNNIFDLKNYDNEKSDHNMLINNDKVKFILKYEIGMSKLFLDNGFKIKSLEQSENVSDRSKLPNLPLTDVSWNKNYYGADLNPIEVMFYKSNRLKGKMFDNYILWNSA